MFAFIVPTGQGVQVAEVAPAAEYDPVWQLPVTAMSPEPAQKQPGLHGACAGLENSTLILRRVNVGSYFELRKPKTRNIHELRSPSQLKKSELRSPKKVS